MLPVNKSLALPIMNFEKQSVILGSGGRYVRSDPPYTDYGYRESDPKMAVLEGTDSVLSVWSETTDYPREYVKLIHNASYDHVIFMTDRDAENLDPQRYSLHLFRVGTYSNWVEAARRWKVKFEERTGAKPLWKIQPLGKKCACNDWSRG